MLRLLIRGSLTPAKPQVQYAPYADDKIPPLPPLKHASRMFTGRETYLNRLKSHFSAQPDGERVFFLLYGLGGIGKTQICLKFIEQNANL